MTVWRYKRELPQNVLGCELPSSTGRSALLRVVLRWHFCYLACFTSRRVPLTLTRTRLSGVSLPVSLHTVLECCYDTNESLGSTRPPFMRLNIGLASMSRRWYTIILYLCYSSVSSHQSHAPTNSDALDSSLISVRVLDVDMFVFGSWPLNNIAMVAM